jgi:hypothetical protein
MQVCSNFVRTQQGEHYSSNTRVGTRFLGMIDHWIDIRPVDKIPVILALGHHHY